MKIFQPVSIWQENERNRNEIGMKWNRKQVSEAMWKSPSDFYTISYSATIQSTSFIIRQKTSNLCAVQITGLIPEQNILHKLWNSRKIEHHRKSSISCF